MVYLYTVYYSAIKRNTVLLHAMIWMSLEYIMLTKSDTKGHMYDFIYIMMLGFFVVVVVVNCFKYLFQRTRGKNTQF